MTADGLNLTRVVPATHAENFIAQIYQHAARGKEARGILLVTLNPEDIPGPSPVLVAGPTEDTARMAAALREIADRLDPRPTGAPDVAALKARNRAEEEARLEEIRAASYKRGRDLSETVLRSLGLLPKNPPTT